MIDNETIGKRIRESHEERSQARRDREEWRREHI